MERARHELDFVRAELGVDNRPNDVVGLHDGRVCRGTRAATRWNRSGVVSRVSVRGRETTAAVVEVLAGRKRARRGFTSCKLATSEESRAERVRERGAREARWVEVKEKGRRNGERTWSPPRISSVQRTALHASRLSVFLCQPPSRDLSRSRHDVR